MSRYRRQHPVEVTAMKPAQRAFTEHTTREAWVVSSLKAYSLNGNECVHVGLSSGRGGYTAYMLPRSQPLPALGTEVVLVTSLVIRS